jgi:signal transduction histidine kinase
VRIDPCQLDQVLINLAVNARDAMSARGVLTIETARADADEVPCSKTPNDTEARVSYVRLSVSDTGTGMDETTQARIFEPFFTTKPLGKGTGLGLSTVFGIVNQNAGYVRVRSQRDAGSTFDVYLPCALDDGWSAGTGAGSEWRADPTA